MIVLLLIIIASVLLFGKQATKSAIGAILTWIVIMAILASIFM